MSHVTSWELTRVLLTKQKINFKYMEEIKSQISKKKATGMPLCTRFFIYKQPQFDFLPGAVKHFL